MLEARYPGDCGAIMMWSLPTRTRGYGRDGRCASRHQRDAAYPLAQSHYAARTPYGSPPLVWRVRLICEIPDAPRPQQTVIGVDLGVNTLIAATDGAKVILVSGRAAKATVPVSQ